MKRTIVLIVAVAINFACEAKGATSQTVSNLIAKLTAGIVYDTSYTNPNTPGEVWSKIEDRKILAFCHLVFYGEAQKKGKYEFRKFVAADRDSLSRYIIKLYDKPEFKEVSLDVTIKKENIVSCTILCVGTEYQTVWMIFKNKYSRKSRSSSKEQYKVIEQIKSSEFEEEVSKILQ